MKVVHLGPLEGDSICLNGRITISRPYGAARQTEEVLDMSEVRANHFMEFAVDGPAICFVSENGVFAKLRGNQDEEILLAAGFRPGEFYVPFANGDYPPYELRKYCQMMKKARESYEGMT